MSAVSEMILDCLMEDIAHEANIEYRQLGQIELGQISAAITFVLKLAEAMKIPVHAFVILQLVEKAK